MANNTFDKTKILIVDDESSIVDSLSHFIIKFGYAVDSATNGREGFDVYKKIRPDLIITDMNMPEMSGMDLLYKIREIDSDVPVIIMTAFADIKSAVEMMKKGASEYILKPFKYDEMILKIQTCLEKQEFKKQLEQIRLYEVIVQNNKIHSRVGANLSHIFNNLLTPLKGNFDIWGTLLSRIDEFTKNPHDDSVVEKLSNMSKIGEELLSASQSNIKKIVDVLKTWWSISEDRLDEKTYAVNLLRCVKSAVDLTQHEIYQGNNLVVEIDDKLSVRSSHGCIIRIFLDLIFNSTNSIEKKKKKFDDFHGEIIIKGWKSDNKIFASIEDNGIGMDFETLEKAKIQLTTSKRMFPFSKGGFYEISGMLQKHFGKLFLIESQIDKGCKIVIEFPVINSEDDDLSFFHDKCNNKSEKQEFKESFNDKQSIICIIETDNNISKPLSIMFEKNGFEVMVFNSFIEADKELSKNKKLPFIVISEENLFPLESKNYYLIECNLKWIILSEDGQLKKSDFPSKSNFVTKPFRPSKLLELIS